MRRGGQVSGGGGGGMPVKYVHMTYNFLEAEHKLAFGPFVWANHCLPFFGKCPVSFHK